MNYKITVLLFITVAFLAQACVKDKLEPVQNLNNNRIGVIGHGGIGFQSLNNELPHNSITSLLKTVEAYGADGVEADIQMSSDKVLFMYHDHLLEESTNCWGCMYNMPAAQIRKCSYKNHFTGNVLHDEKLARLSTLMESFYARGVKPIVFFDMRTVPQCASPVEQKQYIELLSDEVLRIINQYNACEWVFVESTDLDFLKLLRKKDNKVKLMMDGNNANGMIQLCLENGFNGIVVENKHLQKQHVLQAHHHKLFVTTFNVKTNADHVAAINKWVDFIQTDNIPLLQQMLMR